MIAMQRFANPANFLALATRLTPFMAAIAFILLAVGSYLALFVAPPDYQQGDTVRIMFVHVPAAWMTTFCFGAMAVASAVGLIWGHPVAYVAAKATAPIGAAFTVMALVTGALWGQPMWGTWWVWDARLTSVLIQLFIYLGYMALWNAIEDPVRGAKATAIFALVGAVNLPIIKFSVEWWNTLHQPASIARVEGPAIHSSILIPLLIMLAGFTIFYVWLLLVRMRREILARRIRSIQLARTRSLQMGEAG